MTRKSTSTIPGVPSNGKGQKETPNNEFHQHSVAPKYIQKLEPITTSKKNKLPPLKNNLKESRLPNILHSQKPPLPHKDQLRTPDNIRNESYARLPGSNTATESRSTKNRDIQREKEFTEQRYKPPNRDSDTHHWERFPPSPGPGYGQPLKLQKPEEKPAWFDEREKLKRYRKKTEEKHNNLQPIKAVKAFNEKNVEKTKANTRSLGTNSDPKRTKQDWSSPDGRNDRSLATSTSGHTTCTPSLPRDQPRSCAVTPMSTRGTACSSKQGLGFCSKSRLAKMREDEEKKLEREMKEREKLEARIPIQIRKNFKKYGFK